MQTHKGGILGISHGIRPRQAGSPGMFTADLLLTVGQGASVFEGADIPGGPRAPGTCASVWAVETISRSRVVAGNGDIFQFCSLLKCNTILSNLLQDNVILVTCRFVLPQGYHHSFYTC